MAPNYLILIIFNFQQQFILNCNFQPPMTAANHLPLFTSSFNYKKFNWCTIKPSSPSFKRREKLDNPQHSFSYYKYRSLGAFFLFYLLHSWWCNNACWSISLVPQSQLYCLLWKGPRSNSMFLWFNLIQEIVSSNESSIKTENKMGVANTFN